MRYFNGNEMVERKDGIYVYGRQAYNIEAGVRKDKGSFREKTKNAFRERENLFKIREEHGICLQEHIYALLLTSLSNILVRSC